MAIPKNSSHLEVANEFRVLTTGVVGGGTVFIDEGNSLVVTEASGGFGAIPKYAAQKFGELLVPEMEKTSVNINGITASPFENAVKKGFWDRLEEEEKRRSFKDFQDYWRSN